MRVHEVKEGPYEKVAPPFSLRQYFYKSNRLIALTPYVNPSPIPTF